MVYHISSMVSQKKPNVVNIYRMQEITKNGKVTYECMDEPYIEATIKVAWLQEAFKKQGTVLIDIDMNYMNEEGYIYKKEDMPEMSKLGEVFDVVTDRRHYNQMTSVNNVTGKLMLPYICNQVKFCQMMTDVKTNVNFSYHDWWDDEKFTSDVMELEDALHTVASNEIIKLIGEA